MKYMIRFTAIVFAFTLASCGTTEDECCTTHIIDNPHPHGDTIDTPINTDSIETVGELLDSLAAVEPAAKMTH
jgi:hypothetical protein